MRPCFLAAADSVAIFCSSMKGSKMRRLRSLPILIAIAALSIAFVGCGVVRLPTGLFTNPTPTPRPRVVEKVVVATPTAAARQAAPTVAPEGATGSDVESALLRAVYQKVNASVVYIENLTVATRSSSTSQALPESQGSGFVWDTEGHIITNDHVVRGADELQVTFWDGVVLPAELIGTDPDSDLAVIQVDAKLVKLTPVEPGNIKEVQVGQRAIAIGNPFGLVGSMTEGIVSAIGRSIPAVTGFSIPMAIQTDASINPGNSGGPLLNDRGQVIGVNAQIRSATATPANSGIGFAIPINIVQRVVPALIANGQYKHAYLGISGRTYSPAWAAALGFSIDDRGAYVMDLVSGGPSERSGLRAGTKDTKVVLGIATDGPVYLKAGGDLIVGIDNQKVGTFDDILIYLESTRSPGDEVKITVLRAGEGQKVFTVKLGERPKRVQ
jgi:2-alkenal reductase